MKHLNTTLAIDADAAWHRRGGAVGHCSLAVAACCLLLVAACGGGADSPAPGAGVSATIPATTGTTNTTGTTATADQDRRAVIQSAAPATSGGVMINEVVAGSWQGPLDDYGSSEDWVELYNPATTAVDLTGYGLSNKPASPFRWIFPAGQTVPARGYLVVWLSQRDRAVLGQPLHANFNLDSGADPLFLTASNATAAGIPVDSASPPLLRPDQSWCRIPNGASTSPFTVCAQASMNAANTGAGQTSILARPTFSLNSGFYAAAQTLTISGPAGATLRYTTDGSEPTDAATAYTAPLAVSGNRVVRAAAFSATAATSLVMTGTYVVDAALAVQYAGLKALMVAMAPADYATLQANDKTRDFVASFELITGATTSVFKVDAQAGAAGGAGSLDSPQRQLNVAAKDAFGIKNFNTAFWPDKPGITSVKKIRLRNGSNDWSTAHIRDQMSQKAGRDGPNLYGASTNVAMFVNGQYYGLMEVREREEETLPANNLGLDKDFVDFLNNPLIDGQEIKNGGDEALAAYTAMHNYAVGNSMAVAANYAQVKTLMNPESLAWDWALHMFHANYDWPNNNTQVWRSPEVDGRWTWRAHDMDFAFGLYTDASYNMNSSFTLPGSELINALLKSPDFRNLYLNTAADQMNIMTPAYLAATLDPMAAEMRPYIADYYAKNSMGPASLWESRIDALRSYFGQREAIYDGHNRSQFGLADRQAISVAVNDLAMGSVKINRVDTQKYTSPASPTWTGRYYPGVPITLEARPKPGYAFVGWQGASTATTARITQTLAVGGFGGLLPADNFSVRWTGAVEAPASGAAVLQTVADDGVRVWFDNVLVIDNWADQAPTERTANVTLVAGQRHALKVEYYENTGGAQVSLSWRLPGASGFVVVPRERLYPLGAPASAPATGTGLTGQYFNTIDLSGSPVAQRNEAVDFNWGLAAPVVETPLPLQLTAVFVASGAPAAPVFTAVSAQNRRTGELVNLKIVATDPGGYGVSYTAKTLPKGLSMNLVSGVIYGKISTPGSYASVISASNGVATGTLALTWTVSDRPGSGLFGTSPDSGTQPPANVPPTVALTAPLANTSFTTGAAITVSANAADSDGNVARVEFYDGSTLIGSSTTAPYTVVWTGAALGAHSLTAKAYDNRSAITTSTAVAISVNAPGNVPPTVALTAPAANARFTQGAVITVSANAADADGSITRVDFYDGGTLVGSAGSAPFAVNWAGAALGSHTLTARAVDNSGAATTSAAVVVSVAAPTVPPGTGTGLTGRYYSNISLEGTVRLTRIEGVNFDWGKGSPASSVPVNNFSARWTGALEAPAGGAFQFQTTSDDGVRVYLNGQLIIDNWTPHGPTVDTSAAVTLVAGQRTSLVVEFQEYTGGAQIQLRWKTPDATQFVVVPTNRLYTTP